jgi:hypothetical protein
MTSGEWCDELKIDAAQITMKDYDLPAMEQGLDSAPSLLSVIPSGAARSLRAASVFQL